MSRDSHGPPPSAQTPRAINPQRALIEQFIKFCIVGFSSTAISIGILYLLKDYFHFRQLVHNALAGSPSLQRFVDANDLWLQIAGTVGFVFGVTNGFIWNSRWTFPQTDSSKRRQQCFRFFAVNVSGQMVNWIVTFILMQMFKGNEQRVHIAIFGSIFFSAFWNFTLNRLWAFKH